MYMNRLHYRNFVYSIIVLTAVLMFAAFFLLQRIWPLLTNTFQPTFRNIVDACGCSQFITGTSFSWPLMIGGIALAVFSILTVVAVIKSTRMFFRTRRFEATLQSTVISTSHSKGITIYRSQVPQALAVCIGYLKPRIYVTQELENLLSPFELWAVIRHELDHATHRDPLYQFVLTTLQTFFPFLGNVFQHYRSLPELAADEAIHDDGALKRALVKMLEVDTTQSQLAATFFSTAELRINRLLGTPLQRPPLVWLVGFMVLLSTGLSLSYQAVAREDVQHTALSACMAEQPICQEVMTRSQDPSATMLPPEGFMSPDAQSQPFMNILTTE